MRRAVLIGSLMLLLGAAAYAQSVGGDNGIGIRIGGAPSNSSGGGGGGCTGTLDLSTGCPMPMLGVT